MLCAVFVVIQSFHIHRQKRELHCTCVFSHKRDRSKALRFPGIFYDHLSFTMKPKNLRKKKTQFIFEFLAFLSFQEMHLK